MLFIQRQTSGRKISKYLIIAYEKHLKRELCYEMENLEEIIYEHRRNEVQINKFSSTNGGKMVSAFSKHLFFDTLIRQK